MQKQLDMEVGKQIIESIGRLAQIAQSGDTKDANAAAEAAGLTEYVKNQLFAHAGHLMGCWFAIKNEYEPLCNAFASIANRAQGIQRQRQAVEELNNQPPESETGGTAIVSGGLEKQEGESDLVAPPGAPLILKGDFRKGRK